MKIKIFIILLFSIEGFSQIKGELNSGDNLFINTKSGVLLRTNYKSKENYISKIQFGEEVRFIQNSNIDEFIDGLNGTWIEVEYQDNSGYIFSGYTSKQQPKIFSISEHGCYSLEFIETWLTKYFENDSLINSGTETRILNSDEERGKFIVEWKQYKNGNMFTEIRGYEYRNYLYETNKSIKNELVNMLEYFIAERNKSCTEDKYYNKPNLVYHKNWNNEINSIKCYELGNLRIEFMDSKILLEISYEM